MSENIGGDLRVKSTTGTFIAATQRPDGTWRKSRKVKNGYIPQDEQPKFECRAQVALKAQVSFNSTALKYPIGWNPIESIKQKKASLSSQSIQESSSITTPKQKSATNLVGILKRPVAAVEKNVCFFKVLFFLPSLIKS